MAMEIDLARFEELSEGDCDSLLELIQLYLVKTGEQLQELEKAIESGASAHISRIAHSMVGASAMVGMNALLPCLRSLEGHGEKGDLAQAQTAFDEVRERFQNIQQHLKKTAEALSSH